jgi:hypothetical protein
MKNKKYIIVGSILLFILLIGSLNVLTKSERSTTTEALIPQVTVIAATVTISPIPSLTTTETVQITPSLKFKPTKMPTPSPTPEDLTPLGTKYDPSKGNTDDTALFANVLVRTMKQAAPGGDFDAYVEEDKPSLIVRIQYDPSSWADTPESTQKDLVASFVMAARHEFPDDVPHISVKTGVRTAATGEFSIWSGEPTVELK